MSLVLLVSALVFNDSENEYILLVTFFNSCSFIDRKDTCFYGTYINLLILICYLELFLQVLQEHHNIKDTHRKAHALLALHCHKSPSLRPL